MLSDLLIKVAGPLLDRILPDAKAAAEAKLKMLELAQNGELKMLEAETQLAMGQLEVNKAEASSDGLFKGGWRPAVGWVCASGLAYQLLLRPLGGWVMINMVGWKELPPTLEMDTLLTLLFGMLGLGAYRTFEKTRK